MRLHGASVLLRRAGPWIERVSPEFQARLGLWRGGRPSAAETVLRAQGAGVRKGENSPHTVTWEHKLHEYPSAAAHSPV